MKKQTKIVVLLLTLVMLLVGVAFAVSAADAEPASADTANTVTVSYTLPDATEATTVTIEYVPSGTTLLRALEEKSIYYIGTSDAATKKIVFVDKASHAIYNATADVAANATVDGNITVQLTNIAAVDTTDYPVFYDVVRTSGNAVEGTTQTADGFKAAMVKAGDRVLILTLTDDEDKVLVPSPSAPPSGSYYWNSNALTSDLVIDLNGYTLEMSYGAANHRWEITSNATSRLVLSNGKITSSIQATSLLYNGVTLNAGLYDLDVNMATGIVRTRGTVTLAIKGCDLTYGGTGGYGSIIYCERDIAFDLFAYDSTITASNTKNNPISWFSASYKQGGSKTCKAEFVKCDIDAMGGNSTAADKFFYFINTFTSADAKVADGGFVFTDCKIKASGLDNSSTSAHALIYPVTFNNTKTSFNPLTTTAYPGLIKDCVIYDNEDADSTTYPYLATVPTGFGSVTVKLDGEVIFSQDEVGNGTSLATLLSGKASELAEKSIYVGSNGKVIYTKYNVADGTSDGNVYVADLSNVKSSGEEFSYEISGTAVDENAETGYPYFYAFNPDTGEEIAGLSGANNTDAKMMGLITGATKCVIILTNDLTDMSDSSGTTGDAARHAAVGKANHTINMNGYTLTLHMYTNAQRYFGGANAAYLLTFRDGKLRNSFAEGVTYSGSMFFIACNARFLNVDAELAIGLIRGRDQDNILSIENSKFTLTSKSNYAGIAYINEDNGNGTHNNGLYSINLKDSTITHSGATSLFVLSLTQEDNSAQKAVNVTIDNCVIDATGSANGQGVFSVTSNDPNVCFRVKNDDGSYTYKEYSLADSNGSAISIKDTDIKAKNFIVGHSVIPMTITNTRLNKDVLGSEKERALGINDGFVWQMPNDDADYPYYVDNDNTDRGYAMVKWSDGTVGAWADGTLPYSFDCSKDVVKVVEAGKEYTFVQTTSDIEMKANLTLYNSLRYNLLFVPGAVTEVRFNGEVVAPRGNKTVDGVQYVVYSFENTPFEVFEYTIAHITLANGEILSKGLSVVDYLEAVNAGCIEEISYEAPVEEGSEETTTVTEIVAKEGKDHVLYLVRSIAYYCKALADNMGDSSIKSTDLYKRNSALIPASFTKGGDAENIGNASTKYYNNRLGPANYGSGTYVAEVGAVPQTRIFNADNAGALAYVNGVTFMLASEPYFALQMVDEAAMDAVTIYVNGSKCYYRQIDGVWYAITAIEAAYLNHIDIIVRVNGSVDKFVGRYGASDYTNFSLHSNWYYSGMVLDTKCGQTGETHENVDKDLQKKYTAMLEAGKGIVNYAYAVDAYMAKEGITPSLYFPVLNPVVE